MVVHLPLTVQWISFFISVFSFVLSILTLKTTYSVKKQMIHNAEIADFKKNLPDNLNKIEGFINSIVEDGLSNEAFSNEIQLFVTDLKTNYLFLSRSLKRILKKLDFKLSLHSLSSNDWQDIAKLLTALKNYLKKECSVHG